MSKTGEKYFFGHFWYTQEHFQKILKKILKIQKKFLKFFFSSGVSIPTKLTMGNSNFAKIFEKNHFQRFQYLFSAVFGIFYMKISNFDMKQGSKLKMPLENVVQDGPQNMKMQKNRGGGGIQPPRAVTSVKYLGLERVNAEKYVKTGKLS